MARINPKLNLNKTPQNVEDSSLVFAKNIKLNKELSICPDSAVKCIKHWVGEDNENPGLVGKIVGVNNKIYFFTSNEEDSIFEYDELTEEVNRVNCNWNYNGGEITGCVTVNNTGEQILTIAEYNTQADVPIKHINLSKCSDTDDESIYTQHPNIPITNLLLSGYYTCNIPNGVYQFFIRYKIRDEFYTNWFPASKLLFAGNTNTLDTIQGKLKYTNVNKDSNESFILNVDILFNEYVNNYENFQIGFILSNDNGIFARSWNHFSFDIREIYFTYQNINEENIDDLLKNNYELFNIKNVINYKNKLYISNYKESDLNNYVEEANDIKVSVDICDDYVPSTYKVLNNKKLIKYDSNYYNYISYVSSENKVGRAIYGNSNYCYILDTLLSQDPCSNMANYGFRGIPGETKYVKSLPQSEAPQDDSVDVLAIYTKHNNLPYKISADDFRLDNDTHFNDHIYRCPSSDFTNIVNSTLLHIMLSDCVVGIDDNENFIFNCVKYGDRDPSTISFTDYYVAYVVNNKIGTDRNTGNFIMQKTLYICQITCNIKDGIIKTIEYAPEYPHKYNTNTLLFKTKYDFYIHYVKQNGVINNGIYIGSLYPKNSIPGARSTFSKDYIVYPKFNKIKKPNNYVACFISMYKSKSTVCELFNIQTDENNICTADCLELDTALININENILIYNDLGELITSDATYHPSGDSDYFGTAGFVKFDVSSVDPTYIENKGLYLVIDYIEPSDNNVLLTKVTPFIKLDENNEINYNNYLHLDLKGYMCNVSKLKRNDTLLPGADDIFVSGNDVFNKTITDGNVDLTLNEDTLYLKLGEPLITIKSSFNLNFLSLSELITPYKRDYKLEESNNNETTTTDKSQMIVSVNSMISSSIYLLHSMYKDYTIKYFYKLDNKKINTFNNTVRSSNIDVDEVYRDIYKFEAEDYYNVPTNRGIIVNLFSIINKIYVHCEHALFVFTDTNMMKVGENLYTSNNTEVALQQSSPFEIGIQEIFDSEYGYAGLQNKKHSLITFNSYIFYDKLAKTIYAYSGDSVPTAISDGIDKILKWFEPDDIMFAADNTNNRFFINLRKEINNEIKNICLSFNFTSKSFVSIHDIDFDESFNSRINTYFQKNNQGENNDEVNIYKIDNDNINDYSFLKKISILQLADVDDIFANSVNEVANSIDVICNLQYETVKNLNWINWICREVNNYNVNPTITVAEEDGKLYSGHYIRIYSDETYSPLLPLTNNENEPLRSNDVPLMANKREYNPQANTYPRYNCGVWSMNNFRDIRNINANKNPNKPDRLPISDNKSLLYGKYFVVRFIFKDKNFKLENIKFNMGNYEKS